MRGFRLRWEESSLMPWRFRKTPNSVRNVQPRIESRSSGTDLSKIEEKWGNILIRRQGHAISKPEMKDMRIEVVLVKSHKEMSALQVRNGQCSKGDSWSFNQGSHAGQGAHSFSSSKAATQTEGRKPCIFRSSRGASPSGLKGREGPFQNFLKGKCTESPRDLWHPPVCLNY